MSKYSQKAEQKIARTMEEFKAGRLQSVGSGKAVKSPKQAVAIGISKARHAGYRVPPPKP